MVQHFTSLDGVNISNTYLTIGSFDGVHIGHQQLIRELNNHAHQAGAKSVVLTFHPHPAVILRGKTGAFYLTTATEKVELLDVLGTDIVITHPFTRELSQSTARDYVSYLIDHLGFQQLWVGYDFALGKGREGSVPYLKALGEKFGYKVYIVEPVMVNGSVVSSSQIRQLITDGDISEANRLLARSYRVAGEVVHGDGRGKRIGIPTANLETGDEKLIPGAGVYACRVQLLDKLWPAAVNVGIRPTFESIDQRSHVEAYILDYSGDLYTQNIALDFVGRLRGEERFESVDKLIKQIYVDIEQTREIIVSTNKSSA
jgi:riboflavin kinase/FMN adenylyltransferase